MRQFYTERTYGGHPQSYSLLPFRFTRLNPEQELLVNEVGEYVFVPTGTAQALTRHTLSTETELYRTLKARHFLYDHETAPLLDVVATKYRTKKSFLDGFARLHILVITLRCDHTCRYCQVSRQTTDRNAFDMSEETVERSLQLMMRYPSDQLTLEIQGGEPLLAFDRIRFAVARAKELAALAGKTIDIVITSSLSEASDEVLYFCRDEQIKLSTSLDGPAFIHNANRPHPSNNSHALTIQNIARARDVIGAENVAAVMTTTRLSLDYPKEIVDEYVKEGFRSIFLRPISPYGFAVKSRGKTGYEMDRFVRFYKTALEHILSLNRAGTDMIEVYTKILLTKILTPYATGYVDLQSPFGAGISVVVYNYDGKVYAADEGRMLAEMHDHTFCLGNVHSDSYEQIYTDRPMGSLLQASCNETLPGCSDCVFQTYCGADPIFHHAAQGDLYGHRPTSSFCYKNMEILKYLFGILGNGDREVLRMFFAWIRDCGVADVRQEAPDRCA